MAGNKMRHVNKVLAALLILAVIYLSYIAFNSHNIDLLTVYDVEDKYALTSDNYDITIVDFSAYGCAHCQALHPILMEAIKRDGKVRYVPRPISFEWSDHLITAVYAAAEQNKFIEMNDMIYNNTDISDYTTLFKYAEEIGIDVDKLKRDMTKKYIVNHVSENKKYYDAWKMTRTPSLLMDKKAIYRPGVTPPTVEELLEKFALTRE